MGTQPLEVDAVNETTDRVRPFANGFELEHWEDRNCARCVRLARGCEIDIAITEALFDDGSFAPEMADRMGWDESKRAVLGWACAERELTESEGMP
jgi:hypothetical protein